MPWLHRSRRGRRADGGASALEFVMLVPVLFLMILGAVQFAMHSFAQDVAQAAAQAGARTARAEAEADPGGWDERAEAKAEQYVRQLGEGLLGDPVYDAVREGDEVSVTVSGRVMTFLPGMRLTVSETSRGPVERFVPDGG